MEEQHPNQCVALCQNSYIGNKATNICEKLQECSTLFITSNLLFTKTQVIEVHQLNENNFVIQYKGVTSVIDIQTVKIKKTVYLEDDKILVKVIKGNIFILDKSNKLNKWVIHLEQMQQIYDLTEITQIPFSTRNNLIEVGPKYVCVMIVDQKNNKIQFRIIFDISTQEIIEFNNTQYQLIQDNSELLVYQNIVINQSKESIMIQNIYFKERLLIEKICLINKAYPLELTQIYDQNDVILVIKVNKREILYINKEQKICKQLNIKEIKDNIDSIKVEISNNNSLLILKEENSIFIFNVNSNSIQELNLNTGEEEYILDYQITYLQNKYPEIVILTNLNYIYTSIIDSQSNQNQFEKTKLQMINNMYIYKIKPIDQTYSSKLGILISSSESLTILKRNSINQKIEQTALTNYQMPFPAQLGKVKKIIIIEIYSYLVQCIENGYIQIFDISSGYGGHLIRTISLGTDECIDIQSMLSEKIIAVLSTKIVIINLFTCQQEIEIKFDQKNTPSISVNGQYTALSLNGCISLYKNSKFEEVFTSCEQILQEKILNISLNQNLILFLFSKGIIKSVQINLQDKYLKDLNTFITKNQQQINQYEIINVWLNNQEFYIDEILVFDESQTLRIFNNKLVETHSLNIPFVKSSTMIKRAVNDSSFYVFIETFVDGDNFQQTALILLQKSVSLEIIWRNSNYNYSPIVLSPVKFTNQNGIEQLLIRFYMVLDSFCMQVDNIIVLPTLQQYIQGYGYTYTYDISSLQTILDIQSLKSITYAGSGKGELIQYYQDNKIYQVLQISQYFKNEDDDIIQFVNFQILEKYFILLQSYILIFNVFTDEYESIIEFDSHDTLNAKISIIEKNNLFIYRSKNLFFVRIYENKLKYNDYFYRNQETINEWLFDENDSLFYIYGSGFNCLDIQLKLKKEILSQNYTLEKCIINQSNFICKTFSDILIIIDKMDPNNQQIVQVKGFSTKTFKMNIDTKYSLLYLIENYVQVYTLQGAFSTSFKVDFEQIQNIDFQDDYMIVLSFTGISIYDRKSYIKITDFYVSFKILKYTYAQRIKSIIFFCTNPQVSQIFVFDIPSKSMLGKISLLFNQNELGAVADFIYDGENTQVIFLDENGNLQTNMLFLTYEQINILKFIEMEQRKEKPVGFSIDFSTNEIYAYTKKTLFKVSYAQQNDVYLLSLSQNKGLFTVIKQNNNNNNKLYLKYLVISQNNIIFKYQDYQMVYQQAFDQEIIDIHYFVKNKQLIIAFYNQLKVYDNYQYDITYDWNKYKETESFIFEKFVDDDIFITFDKQIIHYDFVNMNITQKLKLDLKSKLTSHLLLSSNQQIVFGFQNGQIVLYFKNNFKFIFVKNQYFSDFENKPVKYILEIDNLTLFISTIEGQIIEYNISSDQITKKYELLKLIKQPNKEKSILSDLKYDKVYKRILFIFIGQHGGYVWGLQENKILSYFSGGNVQKNTITLTSKYIIIQSAFKLNFYELSGESKFIGMIYGNPWYDQIQSFKIVENEIVIILYYEKFMIFYIQDEKIQLIERQEIFYTFILEYLYNKDQKHIQLVLLNNQGISEVMINVPYFINDSIKTCSSSINQVETQLIQMQVQMIQQRKTFDIVYNQKLLTPSNDSEIFLNVDINSEYISFLNSVLKNQQTQQQIVLSPINDANNDYVLQQNSFTQLEQSRFYIKNFHFQINEKEIQDNFNNIYFNSQTQFIIWQNITFSKNKVIKGVQINFLNLTEIIFQEIRISGLTLSISEYKSKQLSSNSLFYFENIERVFIFNLIIENNNITYDSDYSSILLMKLVKKVYIQNVFIKNNKGNINIMRFDLVNQITVDNFKIYSNQCTDRNSQNKFIILIFQGCQEIIVSEIEFIQNEQVQFIQTVNYYELNEETKIYSNDSIQLINVTLNQNNFNFEQIINITQSYVNFKNFNFTSNEGNVKISDAKNITIQKCQFLKNQALNGGALSVYNLKQNLILTETFIIQNNAIGSGGGIYLENIQTQKIEFSADCKIQKNSALIGGGVRILNKSTKQIIPSQYPFNQIVEQNNAELYGDNSCTFLQNILIQNENDGYDKKLNDTSKNLTNYSLNYQIVDINKQVQEQTGNLGYLQVSDFKSGGNLYLNIYFIDENMKKLKFNQDKLKQQPQSYPEEIIQEIESLSIILTQGNGNENSVILTGETILNKNLYNEICNCFQIKQLRIQYQPSITKLLQIQFKTNKYTNQMSQILVSIQFRKCMYGEIVQHTASDIQTCNFCSDGTYTLVDPNSIQNASLDQIICKKCPDSAITCFGNTIKLRNGYWRKDNNTDEILSCNPIINSCKSEDPESRDQGCSRGFVGPLCEVCDLEGKVWGRQYTSSFDGNQCIECKGLVVQYVFFGLQGIGILLFLIYNSFKSFESVSYSQTCYYLRQLELLPISRIQLSSLTTSFIKITLSYLQFSSLLSFQSHFIPLELNLIPNLFGQSNKMIALSIVCIIPNNLIKQVGKSIILSFLNFFLPLFYIFFGLFVFQFFKDDLLPARNQRRYIIFILLSVIYMFFLLDTVQFFTALLTCRQIGSYYYNAIDLSQQCNQEQHIMILKAISASVLVLWTILPIILLFFLRKQKRNLNQCSNKFKYGYFYLELKNKYYYWEFVRILLKLLVVIVNTLFKQEYLVISRQIILLIFAQYIKLITTIQPFQSSELQSMEILSIQLIIAKILLQTSKEIIGKVQMIFEILIFLIDFFFLFYLILNISKYVINNSYSYAGKILQFVLKKICSDKIYKRLTKIRSTQFITYLRWKKIKNNLQNIIKHQANINMSILPSNIYLQQQQLSVSSKLLALRKSKYSCNYRENSFQSKDNEDLLSLNQTNMN